MLATDRQSSETGRGHLLRLQMMGGFRVAVDGREIDASVWKLRKAAAIVKLLALDPSRQLHHEQLMEWLWPDVEPDAAANSLRRTLHVARRILMPNGDGQARWLQRHGDVLSLGPRDLVDTDVDAFETAVRQLQQTTDAERYRHAIDLYSGDLLPEDRYEEWAEQRRASLRVTYLSLLARLSALCEESGRFDEAVGLLQRLIALDPAHEEAHVALMRLYANGGQRRRALSQYQHLRDALQRELDVEPANASQQIYQQILSGELPTLTRQASPVPHLASANGRVSLPPTNLPLQVTSFIGRDEDITEIARLLDPHVSGMDEQPRHIVTLTGTGGCGKTRLAIEVAGRMRRAFPGGIWMVELAPLRDPALLSFHVLAGIPPLREEPSRTAIETLTGWFSERRSLLILDNCEHLIDACAALTETLAQSCADLTILATSRESLRIPGETLWPAPPLSTPVQGQTQTADTLRGMDGPRLFIERARAAQPRFMLTEQNAPLVAEISRKLAGLPLAIELAATRVRVLTLEQINERLDDALRLLTEGPRTAPTRHYGLRAALDWSHDLLTIDEQILLRRLSVFAGGWMLDAAEAVCAGDDLPTGGLLDLHAHLIDKSLVEVDETGAEARYRLLEPVRQYAFDVLASSGEADWLRDRHAEWCHELAQASQREFGISPEIIRHWATRLEQEIDNVRAALRWMLRGDAPSERTTEGVSSALELALDLHWLWQDGHTIEAQRWFERLLSEASPETTPFNLYVRAIDNIGFHARRSGCFALAASMHEQGLALARQHGERFVESLSLWGLGAVARECADFDRANEYYRESLAIVREVGIVANIGQTLVDWGDALVRQGDIDQAEACLSEVLAIVEQHPNLVHVRGQALAELTGVALARGDLVTARRWAEETLAFSRSINRAWAIANALNKLARVALAQGDDLLATAAWCESVERFYSQGDTRFIPGCLEGLAHAACARGEHAQAATLLGAGASLRTALGTPSPPADQSMLATTLSTLRVSLGEAEFDQARVAGAALTIDRAVSYALQTADA